MAYRQLTSEELSRADFKLGPHFTLGEFMRASHRPLTLTEERRAKQFVDTLLEPIRLLVGPIVITSFVRTGANIGAGPHADGRGLDIVPANRDRSRMAAIHALLYVWRSTAYGESLLEVDHIHLSLPGTDPKFPVGEPGQTLVENEVGTEAYRTHGRFRPGIKLESLIPLIVALLMGAVFIGQLLQGRAA